MKIRRQKKIMDIVEQEVISTQEELAEALQKAGFHVTQATISRDIRELRLVKVASGDNIYKYGLPQEQGTIRSDDRFRRMMQDVVISVAGSGNIVVIKTYPGNAQALALLVDQADWPEIIGTVAGDDTILLIVKAFEEANNRPELKELISRLENLMK